MIEVTAPDGSVVSFPDGTDAATIHQAMTQHFGRSTSVGSAASALGTGAASGVVGLPGDIEHLAHAGIGWAKGREAAPNLLPTGEDVDRYLGYDPNTATTAEKYLHGGAAMASGAAIPIPGTGMARLGATAQRAAMGAVGGIASEAAGQATQGTGLEPAARVGAAVLAPMGAGRIANTAVNAVDRAAAVRAGQRVTLPNIAELKQSGSAGNDAFRQSGAFVDPAAMQQFVDHQRVQLNNAGQWAWATPGPHHMLDQMASDAGRGASEAAEISAYRQRLREMSGQLGPDYAKTPEAAAATGVRKNFDTFLNQQAVNNPRLRTALDNLADSNADWGAYKRMERLGLAERTADLRAEGENSGLGFGNKMRQELKKLYNLPGWSSAEAEGIRTGIKGTPPQNAVRMASNVMGGGGGIGTHFGATALGALGMATMGPAGAALAPLGYVIGPSLRMLSNRLTRNQVHSVMDTVARRSALGRNVWQPRSYQGESYAGPAMRTLLAMSQGNGG